MAPNVDYSNLVAEMQHLVNQVEQCGCYTIAVCPTKEVTTECSRIVGMLVAESDRFAGRTAEFSNMGKLSVVEVSDTDVTISEPVNVVFVGWTAKDDSKGMQNWQKTVKRA